MRYLALATALLATTLPAQIWVDAQKGIDTNPGTAALPVKSITAGLLLATPNTTVFVLGGTYSIAATNEAIPLNMGTNANNDGVTLYGIGSVVVDLANAAGTALKVGILANGGRITNITIANMDKNDWWATAISAGSFNGPGSSTGFEIDRCRFVNVNRGIILWQGVPITGFKIHNNLFDNLGNDGINEFDAGSNNDIYNNTFYQSAHLGILTDADNTRVFNNILTGQRVAIASNAASTTTNGRIQNNDFWNNQKDIEGTAFTAGIPPTNFTLDPMFVNAAGGDLHLQAASPLLDVGRAVVLARADLDMVSGVVDYDANGTLRPDVGGYEWTPMALTAGVTSGVLNFNLSSSNTNIPIGLVVFALDDGLIQLGGISPILLDPATILLPGLVNTLPFSLGFGLPPALMRPGVRVVLQGFGFEPGKGVLVGGNQVRLQF